MVLCENDVAYQPEAVGTRLERVQPRGLDISEAFFGEQSHVYKEDNMSETHLERTPDLSFVIRHAWPCYVINHEFDPNHHAPSSPPFQYHCAAVSGCELLPSPRRQPMLLLPLPSGLLRRA